MREICPLFCCLMLNAFAIVACDVREATTTSLMAAPFSSEKAVPAAVETTQNKILKAAKKSDMGTLEKLTQENRKYPFKYTFGPDLPGGAPAFWTLEQKSGHDAMAALADILSGPANIENDIYIWPAFAYKDVAAYTDEEKAQAVQLMHVKNFAEIATLGGYMGPRTAINAEGEWESYVRGD